LIFIGLLGGLGMGSPSKSEQPVIMSVHIIKSSSKCFIFYTFHNKL
jgi:hypothetical protein